MCMMTNTYSNSALKVKYDETATNTGMNQMIPCFLAFFLLFLVITKEYVGLQKKMKTGTKSRFKSIHSELNLASTKELRFYQCG